MRCSRCDMPLSPTKTSCPRCGTEVASGGFKGQGEFSFAFANASFGQKQKHNPHSAATVDVALTQHNQGLQASNVQETPFTAASVPPLTPLTFEQADTPTPSDTQAASARSILSHFFKASNGSAGFGLAGLCIGVACVLLLFVSIMAQTLPPTSNSSSTSQAKGSSLVAQNTPMIDLSPTATPQIASPTATYPGQQYIAHAQTAATINFATAQPTLPSSTFKIGQKIYITFDVQPKGQTGAICLLWYINATQFASYPFAVSTTTTTSAYSYAATSNVGPGYVEIYWENTPSCTDPNKILGDHVDFTVTA